jgi:hypothetical protein
MDAGEIVEQDVQRDCVRVVLNLLRGRIGQARKPTAMHPDRKVECPSHGSSIFNISRTRYS